MKVMSPCRSNGTRGRMLPRVRRRLVSYAAAIAINFELVYGVMPRPRRENPTSIAWVQERPRVDGVWDLREVVAADPTRIVVRDLVAGDDGRYRSGPLISVN